jgi:hypothetical protein
MSYYRLVTPRRYSVTIVVERDESSLDADALITHDRDFSRVRSLRVLP